jgi:hypothetical protein
MSRSSALKIPVVDVTSVQPMSDSRTVRHESGSRAAKEGVAQKAAQRRATATITLGLDEPRSRRDSAMIGWGFVIADSLLVA